MNIRLLMVYDLKSVFAAFATAAGTFGAMSVAGYVIKKTSAASVNS